MTPYEQLGVSPDASDRDVRSAWLRRMRAVHPDRFGDADAPEIHATTAEAQALNAAYAEIKRLRSRPPPEPRTAERPRPPKPPTAKPPGPPRRSRPQPRPAPPPPTVGSTVTVRRASGVRRGRVTAVDPSGAVVSVRLHIKQRGRRARLSTRTLRVPRRDVIVPRPKPQPTAEHPLVGRAVTIRRASGDRRGKVIAVDPAGRFADVRFYIKPRGRGRRLSSRTMRIPMGEIVR